MDVPRDSVGTEDWGARRRQKTKAKDEGERRRGETKAKDETNGQRRRQRTTKENMKITKTIMLTGAIAMAAFAARAENTGLRITDRKSTRLNSSHYS